MAAAVSAFYLLAGFEAMPPIPPPGPAGTYPGDDVIPDAVMVYDQTKLINAPPSDVWPWVQQVGKGRGGWYTSSSFEKLLPASMHAARSINFEWQQLKAGDRVDDYGFSADDYFIVEEVRPEEALIYKSDRYGALFSWSLILHPQAQDQTLLHLRFRGKIAATGLKRRFIVWAGGLADHITVRTVSTPHHAVICILKWDKRCHSTQHPRLTLGRKDAIRPGRARSRALRKLEGRVFERDAALPDLAFRFSWSTAHQTRASLLCAAI